ncbi:MAG: L-aspartate oxidase [Planctomycetes bacterium]|nr:L-aspartate oxidase [Planctomycetota bacterium]
MNPQDLPGRYLLGFDTQRHTHLFTDVAIVGSGVAGLRAAIQAAQHADVLIITKDKISDGSTPHAQGGIAAVLQPDDSFESHIADTLAAGHGLSEMEVVSAVVREGPRLIQEMIQWGTNFDRMGDELHFAREGGHSAARIIHALGDSTGYEIERCLVEKVRSIPNIRTLEYTFAVDLLTDGGRCVGLLIHSWRDGLQCVWAKQTLVATGGCGQVYRETTNPTVVTGDGMAVAYRGGAVLQDMEFVQFHPTTLYVAGATRALISEAVRGEGGILVNRSGERFMPRYHDKAELAPRDAVSLAIVSEMKATGDTNVYLDVRHIPKKAFQARFPRIFRLCEQFDIDIAKEPIPVRPSQHYMVGGIKTDLHGSTNVQNLYACGEVASTGLHGANRLGSNSLLEGLVFGFLSGEAAGLAAARSPGPSQVYRIRHEPEFPDHLPMDLRDLRNSLQSEMWRDVAIERDEEHLQTALTRVEHWNRYALRTEFDSLSGWEIQNMLTVARLIGQCALSRTESRGVHFRRDYPQQDDLRWKRHSTVQRTS